PTRSGQRHRPRPHPCQHAPERGRVRSLAQTAAARNRRRSRGNRRGGRRHPQSALDDRADAGAGWRRTSRMERAQRSDPEKTMTDIDPTGPEIIKRFVRTLPTGAGVYRMLDEKGDVIYVGKARNLKARVTNYTRYEGNSVRINKKISSTRSMAFVRTETEA